MVWEPEPYLGEMVALCHVARGQVWLYRALLALAAPIPCEGLVLTDQNPHVLGVQSSTERQHARRGCGDRSRRLPPGQSTGILSNEQQTNNYRNFQAAYGNLSGRRMKAFCLKTLLQMEKLQISLLFSSERIALCWLEPPVGSVPVAGMLRACQPHRCPSPSPALPTPDGVRPEAACE